MLVNLELFGVVLTFLGEIILALAVLIVHTRIRREGKIDWAVLHELDIDRAMSYVAITALTAGFLFQVLA